jgi:protein-S-isoprenylcysteine O-methyltransferase Ste14
VHFEEARLRRDFAEKYREYCMKVPRWGIKGKFEV